MTTTRAAVQSCLRSNVAWRREAAHLRWHATLPHLNKQQRECLLHEAEAADRQADIWLEGAIEAH